MKLEQQVCSLELAKKLKELGVKQESLYSYIKVAELGEVPNIHLISNKFEKPSDYVMVDGDVIEWVYSAFTVAELGEMLPMEPEPNTYFETTRISKGYWTISYKRSNREALAYQMGDTEADARAKMLVYLLENNLITSL